MKKIQENNWLLEGIVNETGKMIELWNLLVAEGVLPDNPDFLYEWKSEFRTILQSLTKVSDEMEDYLEDCCRETYGDWLYEDKKTAGPLA